MEEEYIKGIISNKELQGGFIGYMKKNYGGNILRRLLHVDARDDIAKKGHSLEKDLETLNNILIEISKKAKEGNGAEIIEMLENKEYKL